MPKASVGEVWLVDLGVAAKVRPCLILLVVADRARWSKMLYLDLFPEQGP
jgi:hypothetical protein